MKPGDMSSVSSKFGFNENLSQSGTSSEKVYNKVIGVYRGRNEGVN